MGVGGELEGWMDEWGGEGGRGCDGNRDEGS